MNANIEKFTAENEPKFKLRKYEEEIIFLIKGGYTHSKILEYLNQYYKLKVTRQTLLTHLKYLKNNKREKSAEVAPDKKSENDRKKDEKARAFEKIKNLGEDSL